jgi:hypothetical protein
MTANTTRKALFAVLPGQDGDRNPVFSMLVKRTYDIVPGEALARAAEDRPFVEVDEYHDFGDAETATVKYEAELLPFKELTDVVFVGKAYAPEGKPVTVLDAGLQVDGKGRKLLRVTGDRQCVYRAGMPPQFTEPRPFTEMELRYENAYGGKDLKSNPAEPFHYPRNPMGKGFAIRNTKETVHGLPLPNVEDPQEPLTPERVVLEEPEGWRLAPMPQGLGWYQRGWYPRSFFCGTLPPYLVPGALTQEERLGMVPKDHIALARSFKLPAFQARFCNGASPGLAFPYLAGNETIRLKNLSPESLLHFRLPGEAPEMVLDIGFGAKSLDPVLHSVLIRGEDRQVDLIWRGCQPYPGMDWLPEMTKLEARAA